jgi:hypothetical protein
MSSITKVFQIRTSLEESRPNIDFELPENNNNWGLLDEVLRGIRPASDYLAVHITINREKAVEWDFYSCAGTFGLFSQRAINTLGSAAFSDFDLLPAEINSQSYLFLRCTQRTECFDRGRAEFTTFKDGSDRIMTIHKHAFDLEALDEKNIFCIPEDESLYCSQVIAGNISNSLKGIRLIEVF